MAVALILLLSLSAGCLSAQGVAPTATCDSLHCAHRESAADIDTTMKMASGSSTLRIPAQRNASGTAWQPDAAPMRASAATIGRWNLMLHGVAFLQYDDQGSRRGDRQLGSVNWGMVEASRAVAGGMLSLRGMASAEPFTVGARGYPLLLQSGETYHGQHLHDRQHPHDLFMELSARYDHPIADDLAVSLYLAPVGEPAIGPVAFPHRVSASNDPMAPIGHHWQDATHISFGVITAGMFTRRVKVEASIFNGREPDEIRTNFDYRGRRLDSYAGRLTINPDSSWSLSGSYAFLASPEQLDPTRSVHRMVASAMYVRPLGASRYWASTVIYGANKWAGDASLSNSVLAETDIGLDRLNSVFARAELVQKSSEDLAVQGLVPLSGRGSSQALMFGQPQQDVYDVGEMTLGYAREVASIHGGSLGIGMAGTLNFVPSTLAAVYGSRTPLGGTVFLRLRPGLMNMGMHAEEKPKMKMDDMNGMRDRPGGIR